MDERKTHTVCGLAEPLPLGEKVLWQGRPDRRSLARHAFHSRKTLFYFSVLVAIRGAFAVGQAQPWEYFAAGAVPLVLLAGAAWGLIQVTAWLTRRASCYAVTDRRIVMKIGIALPTAINLPLENIDEANLRMFRDGTGNLAIKVGAERLSYVLFWPHVRGLRINRPQPTLKSVPGVERAARALQQALEATTRAGAPPKPVQAEGRRPVRPKDAARRHPADAPGGSDAGPVTRVAGAL